MASAKDLVVKPICASDARRLVKRLHYSGKVVNNSSLHFGVFWNGKCEGVMSYGASLDKRKMMGLVSDTGWNEFIELNRMAFSDVLPRNSESRALSIAFRLIKKHYPHIKWVVSFADGAQCGDGTIYRASGFYLAGLKKNNQMWEAPNNEVFSRMSLTDGRSKKIQEKAKIISFSHCDSGNNLENGAASMKQYIKAGFKPIAGFQLKYIYFIDKSYKDKLTVPILPFSKIAEMGASMYKGKRIKRGLMADSGSNHKGGSIPTSTLQTLKGQ